MKAKDTNATSNPIPPGERGDRAGYTQIHIVRARNRDSPVRRTVDTFYIVNDHYPVPASDAASAKRIVDVFYPSVNFGSRSSRRARPATPEENAKARDEWIAREQAKKLKRLEREENPVPTPTEMIAILEQAEKIIYEQARPTTDGPEAYEAAQNFRNGKLTRAILAMKREYAG